MPELKVGHLIPAPRGLSHMAYSQLANIDNQQKEIQKKSSASAVLCM
jgi:hypothetical protein